MNAQITSPATECKVLATLAARLALKGFGLNATDDGPSGSAFVVTGSGGRRTFDSLREVEDFLVRLETR